MNAELPGPIASLGTAGCMWRIVSPLGHPGAIALIWLQAEDSQAMAAAMEVLRLGSIATGAVALRTLLDIDEALVARVDDCTLLMMPHGSIAGVRAIARELHARFGEPSGDADLDAGQLFPEARSVVEARALLALSRTSSAMASSLLLAQHDLWRRATATTPNDPARDAAMRHLLTPPLVIAIGPSNIGKSTLINALAKRHVSIVADEPGTTRDHVGVLLDCAGLTIQYVDTPGIRVTADAEELAARARALGLAEHAALVLSCGDPQTQPIVLPQLAHIPVLSVCLRADQGESIWPAAIRVSARTNTGLEGFIARIRDTLVPAELLTRDQPWKFWL